MRSRIYTGQVMHKRFTPVEHAFKYQVYGYIFDLDELPFLSKSLPFFSYNKRNVVSIHDGDYLGEGDDPIREKLLHILRVAGCSDGVDKVDLVTNARYFNYVFNPVSFYYCYRTDGTLRAVVAEVNNTFHEKHVYVLNSEKVGLPGFIARYTVPKAFHVSPFNDLKGEYDFHFSSLEKDFEIRVNILKEGADFFLSSLKGRTETLTTSSMLKVIASYPLVALKTIPRIYFQAGVLYFKKKMPIVTKPNPSSNNTIRVAPPLGWERVCVAFIKRLLKGITRGTLVVKYPDGHEEVYTGRLPGERATIELKNYYIFPKLVRDGSIGLGDSYVAKDWDTPELATLLKFFLDNWSAVADYKLNLLKPIRWVNWIGHLLNRNSLSKSKENIAAHYDLSNEMFRMFLDPSMTYSSAIFASPSDSLEKAQIQKVDHILDLARIEKNDHVLEIGSGWGTLALRASERFGCRVTSLSLSQEQLSVARERASQAGADTSIDFLALDYREVRGQFDKVVSVEMLEAVGHEYLPSFFATCDRVLKPDGMVVLQVIAFPDFEYSKYLKRQDWIQKRIFPGSHLPSLTSMMEAISKHSNLVVERVENIGPHYARTLKEWNERFEANWDSIATMGFDAKFKRLWQFYLASCEAEFATRWLAVYQIVLTRPNNHSLISADKQSIYGTPRLHVVEGGLAGASEQVAKPAVQG